jgi:allantoinase
MPVTVLKSRRVVTDFGLQSASIVIKHGVIREIMPHDATFGDTNSNVIDYGDFVILPGIVDTHVHINEPGRTEWEGFTTATTAAARGGITTLVDMPLNCNPVTTTVSALRTKIAAAEGKLYVDCGFYGGVIPGNLAELAPMIDAGVLGFKSFLIHSGIHEFPQVAEADIRAAIPILKLGKVPYLMHAELEDPVEITSDPRLYSSYLASRPRRWENNAIDLMLKLSEEANAHLHVVHLSSSDALEPLQAARMRRIPITVETCHHYLTYCSEEIPDGHTEYKCAPPIRERENREKLWAAIKTGVVDFAVSDHSPCTPELKERASGDFMKAWGGIAGLQFSLSVFYTAAIERGLDLVAISHALSTKPAQFVGLGKKGLIAPGKDADFAIFDTDARFRVTPGMIAHRHEVTPYLGAELRGLVRATWLRGTLIYGEGASDACHGRAVLNAR